MTQISPALSVNRPQLWLILEQIHSEDWAWNEQLIIGRFHYRSKLFGSKQNHALISVMLPERSKLVERKEKDRNAAKLALKLQ